MIRRRQTSLAGAPRSLPRPRRPDPTRPVKPWTRRLAWAGGFATVGGLLLYLLWPVLSILVAAAGIAYLLDPLVDRFEARGLSREVGISALLALGLLGTAIVLLLMVPPFLGKLSEIGWLISNFFATIDQRIAPIADWVQKTSGHGLPIHLTQLQEQVPELIQGGLPKVQSAAVTVFKGLFTQGIGLITAALNLTLLPLFAFYLLRDWDRLVAGVSGLIPPPLRPRVHRLALEVDDRLAAFVRGQLTVCAVLAVIYSLGLWAAGIDLPFTVGLLAGALFIVPYLGTLVGVVLASLLAILDFGFDVHLVWVGLVFGGAQLIEGYVLTPKIVGDKVGLHPMVVIIALLVGGGLLGIWGMLLAIPVTATLSVLATEWLDLYRASSVYREGSAR